MRYFYVGNQGRAVLCALFSLFLCLRCTLASSSPSATHKSTDEAVRSRASELLRIDGREKLVQAFIKVVETSRDLESLRREMIRSLIQGNTKLQFYGAEQNSPRSGLATLAFLSLMSLVNEDKTSNPYSVDSAKQFVAHLQIDPALRGIAEQFATHRGEFVVAYEALLQRRNYGELLETRKDDEKARDEKAKGRSELAKYITVLDYFARRPDQLLLLMFAHELRYRVEFIGHAEVYDAEAETGANKTSDLTSPAEDWRAFWCGPIPSSGITQSERTPQQGLPPLTHVDVILGTNLARHYHRWSDREAIGGVTPIVHVAFTDAVHAAQASHNFLTQGTTYRDSAAYSYLHAARMICPTFSPMMHTLASYAKAEILDDDSGSISSFMIESVMGEISSVAPYGLCYTPDTVGGNGALLQQDERLAPLFDCLPLRRKDFNGHFTISSDTTLPEILKRFPRQRKRISKGTMPQSTPELYDGSPASEDKRKPSAPLTGSPRYTL